MRYAIFRCRMLSSRICDCDFHMVKHMLATVKGLRIPELYGIGRYTKPRDDGRTVCDHSLYLQTSGTVPLVFNTRMQSLWKVKAHSARGVCVKTSGPY